MTRRPVEPNAPLEQTIVEAFRDAPLRAAFPDYAALGIPLDFSAEGYKGRLARIRALGEEGKGPLAELRKLCSEEQHVARDELRQQLFERATHGDVTR